MEKRRKIFHTEGSTIISTILIPPLHSYLNETNRSMNSSLTIPPAGISLVQQERKTVYCDPKLVFKEGLTPTRLAKLAKSNQLESGDSATTSKAGSIDRLDGS